MTNYVNTDFYLPPAVATLSEIPTGIHSLYDKALKQTRANKASSDIKYGMMFRTINLDKLYNDDMETGRGFNINTAIKYDNIDKDRDHLIATDSIFSYKFGFRSDDPLIVQAQRCSCKCGKTVSSVPGGVCPHCNTVIAGVQKIRGWMTLNNFKVFNPAWLNRFYSYMKKNTVSEKELRACLYQYKPTKIKYNIFNLQPVNGDYSMLASFVDEFIDPRYKDYVMSTIPDAMSNHIPVLSKDFRHYQVVESISGKNDVRSHPINKCYFIISDNVHKMNTLSANASMASKRIYLENISNNLEEILKLLLKEIGDGKKSLLRGKTVAKRVDNSCRMIIEGYTENSRLDVVTVPYRVFGEITIELYKQYYLNHGVTPEAINRMKSNMPNADDCALMRLVLQDLKRDNLNYLLAYRAPCIYMLSQAVCEITGLTNDRAQVLRFNPIHVDANFKGDFDGDTAGAFAMIPEIILSLFFALNPKRNTYNPITGRYNTAINLIEGLYLTVYRVLQVDNQVKDEDILTDKELERVQNNLM